MKVQTSAAIYLAVQGIAVFLWWVILLAVPESRRFFVLESNSENSLMAFWLADLSLLAGGSIAASWLCFRDSGYKQIAAWFVSGAFGYAALYCLAFAMITDVGWLGVTLMMPAMIWTGVFAVGLTFDKSMFRQSTDGSGGWMVFKTLIQIVVVWSIILVLIPNMIVIVEGRLGIGQLQFAGQKPIAILLFLILTIPGVYAAYTMSTIGIGTPLPLDHAKKLVIRGPYAYLRNPMAVSGIGQGLAVALYFGSPLVALYALMGSAIWQLVFRPLEENNLLQRFGGEYEQYCREVKCWVPRTSAYRSQADIEAESLSV